VSTGVARKASESQPLVLSQGLSTVGPESACGAVVTAHASLEHAFPCVASLREWLPRERIIVVLNEPLAVDENMLSLLQERCVVISPPVPQGYGANLNLGVRALDPKVDSFILGNDDLVFEANSLPLLFELLSDPQVGVVQPTIVRGTHVSRPARGIDSLVAAFNPEGAVLPRPLWKALSSLPRQSKTRAGILCMPGPVHLVRRAAFEAVGGFDEDFFLYYEDADFTRRIACAGWRLVWAERAIVRHAGGSSIAAISSGTLAAQGRALYYKKRVGRLRWIILSGVFLGVFSVCSLYSAAASVVRPSTASRRLQLLRTWWRGAAFFQ
jgi:N-acetylglucosaminyl-diphospho-decaprenol L-rhamnosyltransferase